MRKERLSQTTTILAIRLRLLGDVLATLGALRALKKAAPDHRIVFVVDSHYHPLLENANYIDALLPQPPKVDGIKGALDYERYVEAIRDMHPRYTLDFHSNTRSAILTYLSGAAVRAGFDVRVRKALYTHIEPRADFDNGKIIPRTSHESALALVRRAGFEGVDGPVGNTIRVRGADAIEGVQMLSEAGISQTVIDEGKVVGLNAGNPYPSKAWATANWIDLANRLTGAGYEVLVMWGPGERDVAESIVAGVHGSGGEKASPRAHLAPPMPLAALPGALSALRLLVSIDSGLKHLAVAVGVPTVTLFGPTSPHEWHMGGDRDAFLYESLSCSPCRLKECSIGQPCMTQITPDRVFETVESISRVGVE